jgi:predicted nucleic acid-binding protein
MKDYLLDTNIWSDWYDPEKKDYVIEKLKERKDSKLHLSVVVLGEIHYGCEVLTLREKRELGDVPAFVSGETPEIIEIDRHVSKVYGELRAGLFEKYAPGELKKKYKRPEQLVDPCTSLKLGVQENDIWIVAQAINRGLVLVTNDKKMKSIWDIAGDDLQVEIWKE